MTGARLLAAAASLLGFAACTPETGPVNITHDPRTQQVEIDGYTYFVLIDEDVVRVSNFATGMPDPLELLEGAQAAIATQTECAVTDFFKFRDANRYQARLVC